MYWLTQKLFDVPENDDWLTPNEIICMNKLRFPKRRTEWRLGRWTAKRAIAACFQAKSDLRTTHVLTLDTPDAQVGLYRTANQIEIRAAADGAPEAFLKDKLIPIALSISHRDEIGFCAINPFRLAVGCDVEKVEPRSANFVADYFTVEEEKLVAQAPEQDRHWLATLIWSAKESALKALRQGLRLDTRSVVVDVAQAASAAAGQAEKRSHSERILFESKSVAGNEKDSSRMTKWFTEHLPPTDWNHLTVRYAETAQTFHGWWRIDGKFVQTIVAEPFPLAK